MSRRAGMDALDALSVSVEDADADTDAERALFGEPGMPPPEESWQRSPRSGAVPAARPMRTKAAHLLTLCRTSSEGCQVLGI